MNSRLVATFLAAAAIAAPAIAAGPSVVATIPGLDGGWDYASIDSETNRLFVAHGDTIAMVDLAKPDAATTFAPARHAHAALPIPARHELLVTDGDTASVRLLDTMSGAIKATVAVGEKPDAAIWDARRGRAIVMNAKSGTVMAIDPATAKVTATLTLAPGLEYAAFDERGLFYVNNEDANDVAIVDFDRARVVAHVKLAGCDGPTGMAWAPRAKRIVSSCDGVATLLDPATRRVTGTIAIGHGTDAVLPDPRRNRLYIPAGRDGTVAVLTDSPTGVRLTGTVATARGARTGAVDPRTGKLYLPVADTKADPAGGRPKPIPGTFRILVVEPPQS